MVTKPFTRGALAHHAPLSVSFGVESEGCTPSPIPGSTGATAPWLYIFEGGVGLKILNPIVEILCWLPRKYMLPQPRLHMVDYTVENSPAECSVRVLSLERVGT